MTWFRLVFSILLTLAFAIVSLPQEVTELAPAAESKNPKTAIKVDEFGPQSDCGTGAVVDNFFIQLNNNPRFTGYVIVYSGADSLPSDLESTPMLERIRRAVAFRKYDDSRLVFVKGGFRETQRVEFFLVPPGVEPPEPTNTVDKPQVPHGTYLWGRSYVVGVEEMPDVLDEFIRPEARAAVDEDNRIADLEYSLENPPEPETDAAAVSDASSETAETEDSEADAPDEEAKLTPEQIDNLRFYWVNEKFGPAVAAHKDARGVIIFYAEDQYYDIAKLKPFIEQGRDRIAAAAKISPTRIEVIFGGYRAQVEAEYHIVPKGSKASGAKTRHRSAIDGYRIRRGLAILPPLLPRL